MIQLIATFKVDSWKKSSKMVNLLPVCKHQYSSFVTLASFCLLYPLLESDNKSHHYVKFYKVCSYNTTFILKRVTRMNLHDIKWTKSLAPISEARYIYYRWLRQKKTTYPLALYFEIKAPYTILFFIFTYFGILLTNSFKHSLCVFLMLTMG